MVSFAQWKEDAVTFRKIFFAVVILIVLVGVAAWLIFSQTANWGSALIDAMELVFHTEFPADNPYVAWLFVISVLGAVMSIYILIVIIDIFFMGRFTKSMEEARNMKKMQKLENHYIILGGGSLGTAVARALQEKGKKLIVIEADNERVNELNHQGILALEGDCFEREYLNAAGILKARMVIACLNDDGDNLLVTLLAKEMNPGVKVVAEATLDKYAQQLKKVGADRVIVPSKISGAYIAEIASST